jgi:hypothetical protein
MRTTTVSLACHPQTPSAAVGGVAVRVRRAAGDALALTFAVEGDLARIRVPAVQAQRFAHQLWEHTCFEVFVRRAGDDAYHELNLSPSGEWAGYAFASYRSFAGQSDEALAPRLAVRTDTRKLELDAHVALQSLSPSYAGAALCLALAAVVEESSGMLSYWALRHPSGRPDFHHDDAFALQLEPPGKEC